MSPSEVCSWQDDLIPLKESEYADLCETVEKVALQKCTPSLSLRKRDCLSIKETQQYEQRAPTVMLWVPQL